MPKKANIGATIALDGEAQFRKALSGISSDMKVLSSEMKKTAMEFDDNRQGVEALTEKDKLLNKQIDSQKSKIDTLKKALESSAEQYGDSDNRTKDWQVSLNRAETELLKMNKELKNNADALEKAKNPSEELADNIDDVGKNAKTAGDNCLTMGDVIKANLISQAIIAGVRKLGEELIEAAKAGIELASNLSESQNVVDTTFGRNASSINEWAESLAESYGISELNAKKYSGTMGAMLKSMGMTEGATLGMSQAMVQLAGDMASFYNIDLEEAFTKIRSGISGETEPLKQLGINMSVANLEAYALAQGITEAYKNMTQAEQATLRYNYLMQTTADSQGDFARTSDSLANQQRILKLAVENTEASLGEALYPTMQKVTKTATEFVKGFDIDKVADDVEDFVNFVIDNGDELTAAIAGVATGIVAWNVASMVADVTTKIESMGGAVMALNAVLSTNALGLTVTAIAGLTVGIGVLVALTRDATDETTKLTNKTDDLIKKNQDMAESTRESKAARQEEYESIRSQVGAAEILADTLFDLADKQNKSTSEIKQMEAIVEQLNSALPNMNIALDTQTGLLSKQKNEVEGLIDAQLELLIAQARQEDLTEIAQDLYEAEKNVSDIEEQRSDTMDKINSINKETAKLQEKSTDELKKYGTTSDETQEAMKRNQEEVNVLEESMTDLNTALSSAKSTTSGLKDEYEKTSKAIGDNTSINETTSSIVTFGGQTVRVTTETATAISDMTTAFEEEFATQKTTIQSQMGLFDEFVIDTEITGQKILENLQSQIDGMSNWADNIAILADRGINKGLLQELANMGPEGAGYVAALVSMTDEQLNKLNEEWETKLTIVDSTANEMAELKTEYSTGVANAIAAGKVEAGKSSSIGADMMAGIREGLKSNKNGVITDLNELTKEMLSTTRKGLDSHSPSRKFEEIGKDVDDGLGLGITKNATGVYGSMRRIVGNLTSVVPESMNMSIGTSGSAAGTSRNSVINIGNLNLLDKGDQNRTLSQLEFMAMI